MFISPSPNKMDSSKEMPTHNFILLDIYLYCITQYVLSHICMNFHSHLQLKPGCATTNKVIYCTYAHCISTSHTPSDCGFTNKHFGPRPLCTVQNSCQGIEECGELFALLPKS